MNQPEAQATEATPALTESFDLHWLLRRNADGEIVIRWGIALARLILMIAAFAVFGWITNLILGTRFRPTVNTVLYGFMVVYCIWILGSIQRRAQGKSIWQFHLRDILVLITAIALMLAVSRWERDVTLARYDARQKLSSQMEHIAGSGRIRISGTPGSTTIHVTRPTFDDSDLEEMLKLTDRLDSLDAPITFLDLSGTKITDRGAASLASLHSLEHCYLDSTQITDSAVDALQHLPHLKVLSVRNTGVSTERLKQLSIDRPDMSIIPQLPIQE